MTKYPTKWIELRDGGSDEWLEMRRIGPRVFQLIEVLDLHSVTGEEDGSKYCAELLIINLDQISSKELESAKRCCDFDSWHQGIRDVDAALVECCKDYGLKGIVWSDSGNGRSALHRAARAEAASLATVDAANDALDSKVVNAIGSTARELMAGDLTSAMGRGIMAGNPESRLMGKIYGVDPLVIDNARPVDFMPYVMGYMQALSGGAKPASPKRDPIAPEYFLGYDRGENVKAGKCPAPDWIQTMVPGWSYSSEPHIVSEPSNDPSPKA